MTQVGSVYGEALYELAFGENQQDEILEQLKALNESFRLTPEFIKLLGSHAISKQEAMEIKKTYEDNMLQANAKANEILTTAQKTAAERSDKIIGEAQQAAAQIKSKASADIAQEKKKAINDAKNEISGLALAIAGKVVEKELAEEDQAGLIDRFIDELGDNV